MGQQELRYLADFPLFKEKIKDLSGQGLYSLGFTFIFTLGGITGLILANASFYIALFTGIILNHSLIKIQFYIIFFGVNLTFGPIHFLGLRGIPRRYRDYPDTILIYNIASRVGSTIALVGAIVFILIL